MEGAIRAAGYRITPQRKAILDYLTSTACHPSAHQVFQEAKKNYQGLSLATVYNTLETLLEMGQIKVMDFGAMDNRHEINLTPHINLMCTRCGKIEDFEAGSPVYAEKAKERAGFEVQDYRMEYYGICEACSALIKKDR